VRRSLHDFLSSKAVAVKQTNQNQNNHNNRYVNQVNHLDNYRRKESNNPNLYLPQNPNLYYVEDLSKEEEEDNQHQYNQQQYNQQQYNQQQYNQQQYNQQQYNQQHNQQQYNQQQYNQQQYNQHVNPNKSVEMSIPQRMYQGPPVNQSKQTFVNNQSVQFAKKAMTLEEPIYDNKDRFLSKDEINSIMQGSKQSEDEKFRILEQEMMKITKLNRLDSDRANTQHKDVNAITFNPKTLNQMKVVPHQEPPNIRTKYQPPVDVRQSENSHSIEINNINTSYSDKDNLLNDHGNNNMYVNKSANFIPRTIPNDIISKITQSKEFEKIQKSLETTNDRLRENNNAKMNIMNKMNEHRNVSKFLSPI